MALVSQVLTAPDTRPPICSPWAGPRLRTRAAVPGRAAWWWPWPFVHEDEAGALSECCGFKRECRARALPPQSPLPWDTPVLCSQGRVVGRRPGTRLHVTIVPSGDCCRVSSFVGSHLGGSCVLQADK